MTEPRRKRLLDWKAALGIAISVALLYWVFHKQNIHQLVDAVRAANPYWFALATAAATGVFWIRAWRWKALLDPVKLDTPFRSRFAATMIGFMGNNIFPARAGEIMRAYALTHEENIPIGASVASLAIERLLDGITLLAMLLIALATLDIPQNANAARLVAFMHKFAIIVGIILVILLIFVFAPKRALAATQWVVDRLPHRVRAPIMHAATAFATGIGGLRDPRILARATAWSIVLWLFNALGFYWAFRAFNLDLSFMQAVLFQSAIAVGVAAPGAPGFWGVYEAVAKLTLVGFWGYSETTSNAFAISYHLAGYIPVTLIGMYYAWRLGISRRAVEDEAEHDHIDPPHTIVNPT